MSSESWISRIRGNRKNRKVEKLRQKYEFLVDEICSSQDIIVTKVIEQETQVLNIKSEQLESRIINSLASLQSEQQNCKNEIEILLNEVINKLEVTEESNRRIQEQFDEIHQVFNSILSKIETIQSNTYEVSQKCNAMVEDKCKSILLSIDEVKTLMKIVAVNNLVDEM